MNTKPEALRLADWLDAHANGPMAVQHQAAAELRRLHDLLGKANALNRIRAGNNRELLEALQRMVRLLEVEDAHLANFGEVEAARAAIAKATGEAA